MGKMVIHFSDIVPQPFSSEAVTAMPASFRQHSKAYNRRLPLTARCRQYSALNHSMFFIHS